MSYVLNKVILQPFQLLILSCIWRTLVISYFLMGRTTPQYTARQRMARAKYKYISVFRLCSHILDQNLANLIHFYYRCLMFLSGQCSTLITCTFLATLKHQPRMYVFSYITQCQFQLSLDMVTKIICPLFQIGPDNYMFEEGRRSIPTQPLQMAANSGKET